MKKLLSVLLTVSIIGCSVLLTSCHGSRGKDAFSMPESFDESKTYELTFWAKNDTNKTQKEIYQKAIADFEKIYPNIHVNMKLYTDYLKIYNDVITNISTDTTPNICITYPDNIATYKTGDNVVVPLDDLLVDSRFGFGGSEVKFESPTKDEIVPEFLKECYIDDSCYAVPYMRSTEALYINEDFVKKLGYEIPEVVTWDFIWEVSEKAMEKNSDGTYKLNGQKTLIPFIYKSTDNMMIQYLKQAGADYSDESGNNLMFNNKTTEFLKEISIHAKSGAFSTFKISSYPANFLNAGQCIFAIDSTAGSTWMGSKAPLCDISADKLVEFNTVVRPIPQVDVNNPQMISQGPSICLFNKRDSGEVLASWLFVQYLLTNEVQIAYAQTEGYVPVTTKAHNTDEYQAYLRGENGDYNVKLDATSLLLDNINNTFTTPVFNGSTSLRSAAGALIENVTKTVRRGGVIDDAAISKQYDDVNNLYRLDQMNSESGSNSKDLGPLPSESKTLIATLVIVWILIGGYVVFDRAKSRKKN